MQERTQEHVTRFCPECRANLDDAGVFEVRNRLNAWTKWKWYSDHWDIKDEDEFGDTRDWHLECGACEKTLPKSLADNLWEEVDY